MRGLLVLGDGEGERTGVLLLLLSGDALVAGVILVLLGLFCVRSVSRARRREKSKRTLRITRSSSSSRTTA